MVRLMLYLCKKNVYNTYLPSIYVRRYQKVKSGCEYSNTYASLSNLSVSFNRALLDVLKMFPSCVVHVSLRWTPPCSMTLFRTWRSVRPPSSSSPECARTARNEYTPSDLLRAVDVHASGGCVCHDVLGSVAIGIFFGHEMRQHNLCRSLTLGSSCFFIQTKRFTCTSKYLGNCTNKRVSSATSAPHFSHLFSTTFF